MKTEYHPEHYAFSRHRADAAWRDLESSGPVYYARAYQASGYGIAIAAACAGLVCAYDFARLFGWV